MPSARATAASAVEPETSPVSSQAGVPIAADAKLIGRALFLASGQDDPHSATIIELVKALRDTNRELARVADEGAHFAMRFSEAVQALEDLRAKPYAPWDSRDPDDTIGAMIDNQAWVMMSHIGSFIGHRDGDPDLMERWQNDWAENYANLLKGWFSPHRAAAKYVAEQLTIRDAQGGAA